MNLFKILLRNYFLPKNNNQAMVLVISSDKGLCGGYNSQLAKAIRRFKAENKDEDLKFVWIGKKVRELISKEVNSGKTYTFEKIEPTFEEVRKSVPDFDRQAKLMGL